MVAQSPMKKSEAESHSKWVALECARSAIDKNGENVRILDLTPFSSFTDFFVVCSGYSNRQIQAMADHISSTLKRQGTAPISVEGYSEARWILIDFGDVVVHLFQDSLRDFYSIEDLWAKAPRIPIPAEFLGPGASRA